MFSCVASVDVGGGLPLAHSLTTLSQDAANPVSLPGSPSPTHRLRSSSAVSPAFGSLQQQTSAAMRRQRGSGPGSLSRRMQQLMAEQQSSSSSSDSSTSSTSDSSSDNDDAHARGTRPRQHRAEHSNSMSDGSAPARCDANVTSVPSVAAVPSSTASASMPTTSTHPSHAHTPGAAASSLLHLGVGLFGLDRQAIDQLKSHFLDPHTGRFDRQLELNEFADAFAAVLPGKTKKECRQWFMKIDANSDGHVDWAEFTNFMLMDAAGRRKAGVDDDVADGDDDAEEESSKHGSSSSSSSAGHVHFVRNKRLDQVIRAMHQARTLKGGRGMAPNRGYSIDEEFDDVNEGSDVEDEKSNRRDNAALPRSPLARLGRGARFAAAASNRTAASAASFAGSSPRSIPSLRPPPVPSLSSLSSLTSLQRSHSFHTGMIIRILCLPSYDRFVTAARDGLCKVWDGASLKLVATIKHSPGIWIQDACYLKKSNRIAVASIDRTIGFWDATTFELVSRVRDVGAGSSSVSSNGSRSTMTRIHTSSTPTCLDSSVLYGGEEEVLLVGDDGGNLMLFRFQSDDWHMCDGRGGVSSCRHGEDCGPAGSAANAQMVRSYASPDVTVTKLANLHEDAITMVRYDSRLGMVITASMDRTIKQCDINKMTDTNASAATREASPSNHASTSTHHPDASSSFLHGNGGGSGSPSKSPSSRPMGGWGMDDIVRRTFHGHSNGVYSFDYSKRYKFMASAGLERAILLWDPFTCKVLTRLVGHHASVTHLTINDERSLLMSLDGCKVIKVWNLRHEHWNCIQTIDEGGVEGIGRGPTMAAGSGGGGGPRTPAGNYHSYARGSSTSTRTSATCLYSYRPENRISCIYFDSVHGRLYSAHSKLVVYDAIHSIDAHSILRTHQARIVDAFYIPQFNQVVSGDREGDIHVYDVDSSMCVGRFETGGGGLTSLTLDTGKRRLLTGSADGSVRIWNFSNGQQLGEFITEKPPKYCQQQQDNRSKQTSHRRRRRRNAPSASAQLSSASSDLHSANSEVTSLAFLTLNKSHSVARYVFSTSAAGWDRRISVFLETGETERYTPAFTMPQKSALAMAQQRKQIQAQRPTVQTPAAALASKKAASDRHNDPNLGTRPPISALSSNSDWNPSTPGHKDEILCMCICTPPTPPADDSYSSTASGALNSARPSPVLHSGYTIATGSSDGICLWHFEGGTFFARLIPPWWSTNQALKREAERKRREAEARASSSSTASSTAVTANHSKRSSLKHSMDSHKNVSFASDSDDITAPTARGNDVPSSSSLPFGLVDDPSDPYTLHSPASNGWEALTPLVERAFERLAWIQRRQLLVSGGGDGIIRFWTIRHHPQMVGHRPARMGRTRSETVLAMKVVETMAIPKQMPQTEVEQPPDLQQQLHDQALRHQMQTASGHHSRAASRRASATGLPTHGTRRSSTSSQLHVPSIVATALDALTTSDTDPSPTAPTAQPVSQPPSPPSPVPVTFLLTGDSKGHVMLFDISHVECISHNDAQSQTMSTALDHGREEDESRSTSALSNPARRASSGTAVADDSPRLRVPLSECMVPISHWQAHPGASVVSLDYLPSYKLVLTAGSDGRILLWKRDGPGTLVGMFGQNRASLLGVGVGGGQDDGNKEEMDFDIDNPLVGTEHRWDLHNPNTFKGQVNFPNRSISSGSEEEEVEVGSQASSDSDESDNDRANSNGNENEIVLGGPKPDDRRSTLREKLQRLRSVSSTASNRSDDASVSTNHSPAAAQTSPRSRRRSRHRLPRRKRESALAMMYPSPSRIATQPPQYLCDYDDSPPHTPMEDEARSRAPTPEAQVKAREEAAVKRAKARMTTVDSLARAALRNMENEVRRMDGLPMLPRDDGYGYGSSQDQSESMDEEKQPLPSHDGTPSFLLSRASSLVFGPSGSVIGSRFASRRNSAAGGQTLSGMGNTINSAVSHSLHPYSSRHASGTVTPNDASIPSSSANPPQQPRKSSRIIPPLVLDNLHARRGSTGVPSAISANGGSSTAHAAANAASGSSNGSTSSPHVPVVTNSNDQATAIPPDMVYFPHAPPSSFVPLFQSAEGFEYFKATVFDKHGSPTEFARDKQTLTLARIRQLSRAAAANAANQVDGAAPSLSPAAAFIMQLRAKEAAMRDRVESDEDVDDFYSNEGGHASDFYHALRGRAGPAGLKGGRTGAGWSATAGRNARQERREARRNRMIFGQGRTADEKSLDEALESEDDDDDDAESIHLHASHAASTSSDPFLSILARSPRVHGRSIGDDPTSSALTLTKRKLKASARAQLTVRQKGVSAANIRSRLASAFANANSHHVNNAATELRDSARRPMLPPSVTSTASTRIRARFDALQSNPSRQPSSLPPSGSVSARSHPSSSTERDRLRRAGASLILSSGSSTTRRPSSAVRHQRKIRFLRDYPIVEVPRRTTWWEMNMNTNANGGNDAQ